MKKLHITILITVLILTSCINKPNLDIKGDWLGYERIFIHGNDTIVDNFHLILSIRNDSIYARNFRFITHSNQDSLTKSTYVLSDSNLIAKGNTESQDTLSIEFLNEKTLVLSTAKYKYKFSKLTRLTTEKSNFIFTKKVFTISDSVQIIDTIEFLSDSTILTYNFDLDRPNQIHEWRKRKYLGHSLLIIDSREFPVFLLETDKENNIGLKREPNESARYKLKRNEFEPEFTHSMLIGAWSGKSNKPDNELIFIFDFDSVQMNEFTGGEILTTKYSLNFFGTKLFFFHKYASDNIFYKIKKINHDSIFLTRLSPIKDSFILTRTK